MAHNDRLRVAVIGAGPVGLEAALYARSLKLPVTIYERGRVGEHVQRWGHVRLFSPFGMNSTPLGRAAILAEDSRHAFPGDGDCITGREHCTAYLEPLARARSIAECLKLETQVVHVGRHRYLKDDVPGDSRRGQEPFRLIVRHKNLEETAEADVVLDCSGTYGQHRWMGDGGIPALGEAAAEPHVAYGVEDVLGDRRNHYAGKNVLVLGAGYSAASTVCDLTALAEANHDTWTIWLARTSSTQPLKRVSNDSLKERDRLAMRANKLATRADGNVEYHKEAIVDAIECAGPDKGFKVTTYLGGEEKVWEVDRVIANVGYVPDTRLYVELQVHECYATQGPIALAATLLKHAGGGDCLQSPASGAQLLRNPEPNFFILGAKSYGRNSQFLLRGGFDQVREAFSLVMQKPTLDLYRKA